MTGIVAFLLAWLVPFILGTVISLACLKRRYGYKSLAIGSGYLLGLLITLLTQKYATSVGLSVVLLTETALAGVIGFFFRAKRCTIEEQRLEKAPPNWAYFVSWFLVAVLLFRWFVTYADFTHLISKETVVTLTTAEPLWKTTDWGLATTDWVNLTAYYQTFLTDSQKYFAQFPWLVMSIVLGLIIFGGLRYLGSRLLPAMFGAYMALSLPFIISADAVANALSIAMLTYYLWSLVLLAILIGFFEKRPVLLIISALYIVSAYQYWLFFVGVIAVAYVLGRYASVLVAMLSAVALLLFGFVLMGGGTIHYIMDTFRQVVFIENNWHFAVLSALIALPVFMVCHRRHDTPALELLLIGSLVNLFAMIGLLIFGQYDINNHIDVMSIIAYFTPLLCFVPITVYHLITDEKDSLPVI